MMDTSLVEDLRNLDALGLSSTVIAAALDVEPRTVERWRSEGQFPQRDRRTRFAALMQVVDHLYNTFTAVDAARLWLGSDLPYLGGMKPVDALRAGRIDRVEAALTALDSGFFV